MTDWRNWILPGTLILVFFVIVIAQCGGSEETATLAPVPTPSPGVQDSGTTPVVVRRAQLPQPVPTAIPVPTSTPRPGPLSPGECDTVYFQNKELMGEEVVRREKGFPDKEWHHVYQGPPSTSPFSGTNFSAKLTCPVAISADGNTLQVLVDADDGVLLKIAGQEFNAWKLQVLRGKLVLFEDLPEGTHDLEIAYFQAEGEAFLKVIWQELEPPASVPTPAFAEMPGDSSTPPPSARIVEPGAPSVGLFFNETIAFPVRLPNRVFIDTQAIIRIVFEKKGVDVTPSDGLEIKIKPHSSPEINSGDRFDLEGGKGAQVFIRAGNSPEVDCFDRIRANVFTVRDNTEEWRGDQTLVEGDPNRGTGFCVKNPVKFLGNLGYNQNSGTVVVSAIHEGKAIVEVTPKLINCPFDGHTVQWWTAESGEFANGGSFRMLPFSDPITIQATVTPESRVDLNQLRQCVIILE